MLLKREACNLFSRLSVNLVCSHVVVWAQQNSAPKGKSEFLAPGFALEGYLCLLCLPYKANKANGGPDRIQIWFLL